MSLKNLHSDIFESRFLISALVEEQNENPEQEANQIKEPEVILKALDDDSSKHTPNTVDEKIVEEIVETPLRLALD